MITPNTDHPSPFSAAVLEHFRIIARAEAEKLGRPATILDPYAGIGRIHDLRSDRHITYGIELEPEWAACRKGTDVGDALDLPFPDQMFDMVMTSPTYGNRMSDHHNAQDGSKRRGYKWSLHRDPTEGSSALMSWGDSYREHHRAAIAEMDRVLEPGGLLVVNMSNHIRDFKMQRVVEWWIHIMSGRPNLYVVEVRHVGTPRMRYGANHLSRVLGEHIIVFRKETDLDDNL